MGGFESDRAALSCGKWVQATRAAGLISMLPKTSYNYSHQFKQALNPRTTQHPYHFFAVNNRGVADINVTVWYTISGSMLEYACELRYSDALSLNFLAQSEFEGST